MIYLGVDPGTTNNMAVAALHPTGQIQVRLVPEGDGKDPRERARGCARRLHAVFMSLELPAGVPMTVALEWQRPLKTDRRPQNISDLSAFAGIALAMIEESFATDPRVYTPLPEEWKHSVKKFIKHNRIVAAAGLGAVQRALAVAGIPVPSNLGKFDKEFTGMAGNAIDALGLAQWAKIKALGVLRSVVPG